LTAFDISCLQCFSIPVIEGPEGAAEVSRHLAFLPVSNFQTISVLFRAKLPVCFLILDSSLVVHPLFLKFRAAIRTLTGIEDEFDVSFEVQLPSSTR